MASQRGSSKTRTIRRRSTRALLADTGRYARSKQDSLIVSDVVCPRRSKKVPPAWLDKIDTTLTNLQLAFGMELVQLGFQPVNDSAGVSFSDVIVATRD